MRRMLVAVTLTTLTIGCGGEFIEGSPTVLPNPPIKVGPQNGVTISKRVAPANLAREVVRPDQNRLLVIPEDSRLDIALERIDDPRTFSLELWVRLDDILDQTVLYSNGLSIAVRDQILRVRVDGVAVRGRRIVAGEWYHVAVALDRGELRFFINGALSGLSELNGSYDDALGRTLHIGGVTEDGGRGFSGRVDNLRLLSVPITTARGFVPSTVLTPRDGVVAAFDFNAGEAPGERVKASVGTLSGELVNQARVIDGSI